MQRLYSTVYYIVLMNEVTNNDTSIFFPNHILSKIMYFQCSREKRKAREAKKKLLQNMKSSLSEVRRTNTTSVHTMMNAKKYHISYLYSSYMTFGPCIQAWWRHLFLPLPHHLLLRFHVDILASRVTGINVVFPSTPLYLNYMKNIQGGGVPKIIIQLLILPANPLKPHKVCTGVG